MDSGMCTWSVVIATWSTSCTCVTSQTWRTCTHQQQLIFLPPFIKHVLLSVYMSFVVRQLLIPANKWCSDLRTGADLSDKAADIDRACTQAGPTSSLERRVAQHTFTHASLISESSAALTNFPHPCGLVHWTNLWGRPQHWRMKGGMRHRR